MAQLQMICLSHGVLEMMIFHSYVSLLVGSMNIYDVIHPKSHEGQELETITVWNGLDITTKTSKKSAGYVQSWGARLIFVGLQVYNFNQKMNDGKMFICK